ncbi:MAG TPA: nuclear transport factor 2 family protein [Candidatus Bathyarchaeia archaeon]|nr:nuclear transport factor 2 family protein [Candidatus Bathyarchaeia archaeon]
MNAQLEIFANRFLDAWDSQDVERVLACYTDDLVYRDPNTRGDVHGANAMRRYLTKLFSAWEMTWTRREVHPLASEGGGVLLWHATFRKAGGNTTVEADGMDLVMLKGDRACRNEVYFDRSILAPLLQ